jgi:hypothetical protein
MENAAAGGSGGGIFYRVTDQQAFAMKVFFIVNSGLYYGYRFSRSALCLKMVFFKSFNASSNAFSASSCS